MGPKLLAASAAIRLNQQLKAMNTVKWHERPEACGGAKVLFTFTNFDCQ